MKKKAKLVLALFAVPMVAVLGEFCARYCIGLGDPPLSIPHPTIEYLFRPRQDAHPFGNRFIVNDYGMRTENFPSAKPRDELRIIVFGDSVIDGGNLTDQAEIATTLLGRRLRALKGQPVVVGNVSAGSWGPGNWLAYAREYGFFDADVIVLVVSSHDYADNPTFEPLNPDTHPQSKPWSALGEGVVRYLGRYLPSTGSPPTPKVVEEPEVRRGLADLRSFLLLAKAATDKVLVAQFPERGELESGTHQTGYALIRSVAQQCDVGVDALDPWFRQAAGQGERLYRDYIHINARGQSVLAQALFALLIGKGMIEPARATAQYAP